MTLTVITPVLNEAAFLPMYLDSVVSYAYEIIIVDGGSTDGSLELIKQYQSRFPKIRLFEMKQTGLPYSDDWNESLIRNFMIAQATGRWIANIDADEIFDDRFFTELPSLMSHNEVNVYQFPIVNFWGNPWTVRVNALKDERWSNDVIRLWRNGIGIKYEPKKHHCFLTFQDGRSIWSEPRVRSSVPIYHYHYAFGKRIKHNDNRRGDLNVREGVGEPDWSYRHGEYEICTIPFQGQHPSIVQYYLQHDHK